MRPELFVVSFCRSVVLIQGQVCPPENIWQCPEIPSVAHSCGRQGCAKHPVKHRKTSYNSELPGSERQWCPC